MNRKHVTSNILLDAVRLYYLVKILINNSVKYDTERQTVEGFIKTRDVLKYNAPSLLWCDILIKIEKGMVANASIPGGLCPDKYLA